MKQEPSTDQNASSLQSTWRETYLCLNKVLWTLGPKLNITCNRNRVQKDFIRNSVLGLSIVKDGHMPKQFCNKKWPWKINIWRSSTL